MGLRPRGVRAVQCGDGDAGTDWAARPELPEPFAPGPRARPALPVPPAGPRSSAGRGAPSLQDCEVLNAMPTAPSLSRASEACGTAQAVPWPREVEDSGYFMVSGNCKTFRRFCFLIQNQLHCSNSSACQHRVGKTAAPHPDVKEILMLG